MNYDLFIRLHLISTLFISHLAEVDNTRLDDARTMRYTGIIVLVVIEYKNSYTFNTSDIRYTVTARQIANSQFKALQQIYTTFPNEFVEWNRHGIRLLFQRTGQSSQHLILARKMKKDRKKEKKKEISQFSHLFIYFFMIVLGKVGKFDFQTMLINIIAGAALISLSTVAVDIIAVYLLPQKKFYGNFKYEPTPGQYFLSSLCFLNNISTNQKQTNKQPLQTEPNELDTDDKTAERQPLLPSASENGHGSTGP